MIQRARMSSMTAVIAVFLFRACNREQGEPTTAEPQSEEQRETPREKLLAAESEALKVLRLLDIDAAPGERIVGEAEFGLARWDLGPAKRETAIASFERVLELAFEGRQWGETNERQLERYEAIVGPDQSTDELVSAVSTACHYLKTDIRCQLNQPAKRSGLCDRPNPMPEVAFHLKQNLPQVRPRVGASLNWTPGDLVVQQSSKGWDFYRSGPHLYRLSQEGQGPDVAVWVRSKHVGLIAYLSASDLAQVVQQEQTIKVGKANALIRVAPGARVQRDQRTGKLHIAERGLEVELDEVALELGTSFRLRSTFEEGDATTLLKKGAIKLRDAPRGRHFATADLSNVAGLQLHQIAKFLQTEGRMKRVKVFNDLLAVEGWIEASKISHWRRMNPDNVGALMGNQIGDNFGYGLGAQKTHDIAVPAQTLLYDRPEGCVIGQSLSETLYQRRQTKGQWTEIAVTYPWEISVWVQLPEER